MFSRLHVRVTVIESLICYNRSYGSGLILNNIYSLSSSSRFRSLSSILSRPAWLMQFTRKEGTWRKIIAGTPHKSHSSRRMLRSYRGTDWNLHKVGLQEAWHPPTLPIPSCVQTWWQNDQSLSHQGCQCWDERATPTPVGVPPCSSSRTIHNLSMDQWKQLLLHWLAYNILWPHRMPNTLHTIVCDPRFQSQWFLISFLRNKWCDVIDWIIFDNAISVIRYPIHAFVNPDDCSNVLV